MESVALERLSFSPFNTGTTQQQAEILDIEILDDWQ